MDVACSFCNISDLRGSAALEKHASVLLEGSADEYTEIALECQGYFRNITKEITAIPDDGICYAPAIYCIPLPI